MSQSTARFACGQPLRRPGVEPIVCTPEDAYRCFMRTEMDALVLENFILSKTAQPTFDDGTDWKNEFVLD